MMSTLILQLDEISTFNFLLILILILIVLSLTFGRMQSTKLTMGEIGKIKTELCCTKCGLREIRDFREGDYISRVTGERCKRCGELLKVDIVYRIEEKEEIEI